MKTNENLRFYYYNKLYRRIMVEEEEATWRRINGFFVQYVTVRLEYKYAKRQN